jgi:hypothetical protein
VLSGALWDAGFSRQAIGGCFGDGGSLFSHVVNNTRGDTHPSSLYNFRFGFCSIRVL